MRSAKPVVIEEGQPTVEHPALLCLALDASDTMIDSVIDHFWQTKISDGRGYYVDEPYGFGLLMPN